METALDGDTFGITLDDVLVIDLDYADDKFILEVGRLPCESAENAGSGDDQGRRGVTINQCPQDKILRSRQHDSTPM